MIETPKENIILNLTYEFSLSIISYVECLEENKKFVLANQLLKSGTSIGANIREAQTAESKADFIHKFKIAHKEVKETEYWLMLCRDSKSYPSPLLLIEKLTSIDNIIAKIIISSKSKL